MTVKIRKVGNSFTVTIPMETIDLLNLSEGQELDIDTSKHTLNYIPIKNKPTSVDWDKYVIKHPIPKIDGMTTSEYIRSMRDNDRENIL